MAIDQTKRYKIIAKREKAWGLTFETNGVAEDITGSTIYFTVKTNKDDTDANAVISKTVTSHTNPTAGLSAVVLSASDTDITPGSYFYEFVYKPSGGDPRTFLTGVLVVEQNIRETIS